MVHLWETLINMLKAHPVLREVLDKVAKGGSSVGYDSFVWLFAAFWKSITQCGVVYFWRDGGATESKNPKLVT